MPDPFSTSVSLVPSTETPSAPLNVMLVNAAKPPADVGEAVSTSRTSFDAAPTMVVLSAPAPRSCTPAGSVTSSAPIVNG